MGPECSNHRRGGRGCCCVHRREAWAATPAVVGHPGPVSCAVEMPGVRIARVPAASWPARVRLLQDRGAVIAGNPSGRYTGSGAGRNANAMRTHAQRQNTDAGRCPGAVV